MGQISRLCTHLQRNINTKQIGDWKVNHDWDNVLMGHFHFLLSLERYKFIQKHSKLKRNGSSGLPYP